MVIQDKDFCFKVTLLYTENILQEISRSKIRIRQVLFDLFLRRFRTNLVFDLNHFNSITSQHLKIGLESKSRKLQDPHGKFFVDLLSSACGQFIAKERPP